MITFRRLEHLGRLGNQLWQIASTVAIARRHDMMPVFKRWTYAPYFSVPDEYWADEVPGNAIDVEGMPDLGHIVERHRPYLQDLSLIEPIAEDIRAMFSPSPLAKEIIRMKFADFVAVPREQRIAVHVRRGDALAVPHLYPVQSTDYFRRALEMVGPGHVFVFSDDHSWVRNNVAGDTYVSCGADFEDLLLMASCAKHIIGNSSYSWWASWLSGDPAVLYPFKWYGPDFHDLTNEPIIPAGWIPVDDPRAGQG